MGVSYKRLQEIIREEIIREHTRLTGALIENLANDADDDIVMKIAEFVRTRSSADGSDLDTLPKADLMQIIVDAAIDEKIEDQDLPEIEAGVLEVLIQQSLVPASYRD